MRSKVLADISVAMWLRARERGFKANCKCSFHSLSRYIHIDGVAKIRLSDHPHRNEQNFDYQIIATEQDDPKAKMTEAMELIERLLGVPASAAA